MPLSVTETKELLIQLFRLTLASSEKRTEDSVQAFSNILDVTLPSADQKKEVLVNDLCNPSQIDLIISEINAPLDCSPVQASNCSVNDLYDNYSEEDDGSDASSDKVISEAEDAEASVTEAGVAEASVAEASVAEANVEVAEADVEEADVAITEEEQEEEKEEEEEEALEVEPVRIRKIIYWKDINTGYIYTYLPDDEVGEKVGAYVGGKPEFD